MPGHAYFVSIMSSRRWLSRQASDPYVKQARSQGYRARAAFKLLELDERERLLRPGQRIVDLGAAPGSWSQVAQQRVGPQGRVVALDILPMEPLAGVDFIEGDFREVDVLQQLETLVGGRVDLVMSDMAPNISGIAASDQARSMDLAELALEFAVEWLEPEGRFVVKLFQGEGFDDYVREARRTFKSVRLRKPAASRKESREVYMVADSRRPG
jgi:23S rRNA (uridine2552-2'-O)-methyltransferase